MKTKIYSILAGLLLTTSLFAQAPQTMTYQAVVRDNNNNLVVSSPIGIRVSILNADSAVYVETHTTQTNQNGLFDIVIGGGTIVSGNYYTDIYWPSYQYFLKTEIDPLGGTAYTITSTSALLSVPYSNYSLYSGYCLSCFQHYIGELYQDGMIVSVWKVNGVEHGLIASLTDLSVASDWNSAFSICDSYQSLYFFSDWYLPNSFELSQCYNAAAISQEVLNSNGFQADTYWSSSPSYDANTKVALQFANGGIGVATGLSLSKRVRAVRKF